MKLRTTGFFLLLLALVVSFVACGGGGGEESYQSPPPPAGDYSYMLSWDVPDATIDNTTIDPYEELDHYEIYISADGTFGDEDAPVALVSAVEDAPSNDGQLLRQLVTEFDLALLVDLPSENQLYVTLRAVGVDGQKSEFMEAVPWVRS